MTSFTTDFTILRESIKASEETKRSVMDTTGVRTEQEAIEALWAASSRRVAERRRREIRALWYAYHTDQAERLRRTMEPLIALHEARARQLLEEGQA